MKQIGIIGGGLIGAGWAALFAHTGFTVRVFDQDPETGYRLNSVATNARSILDATVPHVAGGCIDHVTKPEVLQSVEFVQECLPESQDIKRKALSDIEPFLGTCVAIASSSSGLDPDEIGAGLSDPGRVLIGHPCNPPYLMPVVEIVAGRNTADRSVEASRRIYRQAGRCIIEARRAVPGHIVNRLQAALWREVLHLWREGVATLDDLELAVKRGLAPRWCLLGPTDVFQVSGGRNGMAGFTETLGAEMDRWWADLGAPRFDQSLAEALVTATKSRSTEDLVRMRDVGLPVILKSCGVTSENSTETEENHEMAD